MPLPASTSAAVPPDAVLCADAWSGDRTAFRRIVERYQNLVCSIAYSALGDVGRSEDVAQETFLVAWKSLGELKDPTKLKAWLCGIARRLVSNDRRRAATNITAQAETLGDRDLVADDAAGPPEIAIRHEEEFVLWEVLSNLPPQFREPLVLYHRGEQSVAEVAAQLDLSEDAVKQRLARGRKLLKTEVAAFVEKALRSTRPSALFAGAVLAAIPASAPPTMAAGLVAAAPNVGGKIATAAGAGMAAAILGPILGLVGAAFGVVGAIASARSPRERRFVIKLVLMVQALVAMLLAAQWVGYKYFSQIYRTLAFQLTFWGCYTALLIGLILWAIRRARQIQREEGTDSPSIGGSDSLGQFRDLPLWAVTWHMAGLMYVVVACSVVLPGASAGDWVTPGIVAALTTCVWMEIRRRLSVEDSLKRRLVAYLVAIVSSGAIAIVACAVRWSTWQATGGKFSVVRTYPLWAMTAVIFVTCGGIAVQLLIWYRKVAQQKLDSPVDP